MSSWTYKNLVYFSTTKLLTHQQAQWSKLLSAFNMVIHFHPGQLGRKLDAMTRQWDIYSKEGGSDYTMINPHNMKPIFISKQLITSICATYLIHPLMCSVIVMGVEQLHNDILRAISKDPIAKLTLAIPMVSLSLYGQEIHKVSLGLMAVSMCQMSVHSVLCPTVHAQSSYLQTFWS
jgi:hypothetical protein